METIKKIYVNADGQPIVTYYNGSWHVIKHNATDNLDYSITIWDTIYEGIYEKEEELGYELEGDEYTDEVAYILETMADVFGFELVKE